MVRAMANDNITVSTIVVGRIVNVVNRLEGLAKIGGGRCYQVDNGKDLLHIMEMDSVLSQVAYTVTDPIKL